VARPSGLPSAQVGPEHRVHLEAPGRSEVEPAGLVRTEEGDAGWAARVAEDGAVPVRCPVLWTGRRNRSRPGWGAGAPGVTWSSPRGGRWPLQPEHKLAQSRREVMGEPQGRVRDPHRPLRGRGGLLIGVAPRPFPRPGCWGQQGGGWSGAAARHHRGGAAHHCPAGSPGAAAGGGSAGRGRQATNAYRSPGSRSAGRMSGNYGSRDSKVPQVTSGSGEISEY
jgi:hypothetical protein